LKKAIPTPSTSGNLFETVDYGTSIYGGWNSPADREKRKKTITSALLFASAAGLFLISAINNRKAT
jgi:hypothetical protein